ncbi:MAG: hypothetical protein BAJALOKI3v1_640010 [Promethearchaeota archaeon]|nr:MAG: hypothetical protein BAJALOKI3v1_640010 [Candidatus Lokiarchaeota archaeon]
MGIFKIQQLLCFLFIQVVDEMVIRRLGIGFCVTSYHLADIIKCSGFKIDEIIADREGFQHPEVLKVNMRKYHDIFLLKKYQVQELRCEKIVFGVHSFKRIYEYKKKKFLVLSLGFWQYFKLNGYDCL